MKPLQKLTGISIFLIFIFMIIALFQYQSEGEEDIALLPNQFEIYYNEHWNLSFCDSANLPQTESENILNLSKFLQKTSKDKTSPEISLPYTKDSATADILIFQNTLPIDYTGLNLNFTTTNSNLIVVLDDTVIYQYEFKDSKSNKRITEQNEHYIDIPNTIKNGTIWILLMPSSQNVPVSLGEMKIESRDMVVIGVVGNNISDIACCLIIFLMAIILFVLALIRKYTNHPVRGEFFLGLTGFASGIYCFIGTDTLNLFYDMQNAYETQEYLVLLIPLFLTLYFERNLHTIYPRRFSVLLWFVSIQAVVQILLHIFHINELENMINISAAAVGAVCITAIASLIQYDYTTKRYQTILSILSVTVLLTGEIATVIVNRISQNIKSNAAGQYSMTIFCIMMAVMHTLQLSKEYRASAEEAARLLEEKVKAAELQNRQLAIAKKDAEAARQEALDANNAKGKFLAHMSHEIRTPINAVLGMDEMILRESKEQSIREYAMDIYMAGQTLLSLINDILDFSKIESGKMEIVPIEYDVSSMIHDLANMTLQRAKNKNIAFEVDVDCDIPSRLYGDDVRIRQVLTNILTNAVKYTHEGTVWLRIKSCCKDGVAQLTFEVEDTGIGIKEEDLPKLSAEFERIEEEKNRNIEGTGLGMNITIQLLTLLGSKLQVESAYGTGSKFYFQLEQKIIDETPIGDFESRVQQIAENYKYHTKFCAPDAKILVVDDNAVNRKVLLNLLKETQIQVFDAEGGAECLELVQKNYYDLIFLDHMMPEMDGLETLRHIKTFSDFPCQNTPIVVLTANAVSGAKEKYLADGFDGFLSKPIVPEKLEQMIQQMLPKDLIKEAKEAPGLYSLPKDAANAQTLPEDLPQIDGLDWQYAWLHLPDMELLAFTIKEFYAQIDSSADHLESLCQKILEPNQLEEYRILVHAMKSLSATVGILPLSGAAKLLENAAKDGKIEFITSMTSAFLEDWRSYHQKLQGVFGIENSTKKEMTDTSVIQALVEMIRFSMQEMDIDQADQLIGQLQAYSYSDDIDFNIKKLAEAVTNLDPEEADRLADLLLNQIKPENGH